MAEYAVPRTKSTRPAVPDGWYRELWAIWSIPFVLFLSLPLFALILRASPLQVAQNLMDSRVVQAITISLGTTVLSALVIIILGTPVAYILAFRSFPFRRVIDTLVDLPTVLPPAVAGVALLLAFGRNGMLGGYLERWGVHVAFTFTAVVLAQTFIAAPFFIKTAMIGFASVETDLRQAAALDGANSWQQFRFVVIPRSATALVRGTAMAWARALGEFGATIIFAGNLPGRTQTMPLAIYLGFEMDLDIAVTLSVILVMFSFLVLLVTKFFVPRFE